MRCRDLRPAALGVMLALMAGAARPVRAADEPAGDGPWGVQGNAGATLLDRPGSGSALRFGRAVALGVDGGHRFGALDLFLRAEGNLWTHQRDDGSPDAVMALNLGLGAGFNYAADRLRSSLALGPSILVLPTDIDSAGSVGLFAELRPVAFRWPIGEQRWLGLCPLSFNLTVPVLTGIPLIEIEFRTTFQLEQRF